MIQQMIVAQAVAMGVDPNIALSVAKHESDFQQFDPKTGGVLTNKARRRCFAGTRHGRLSVLAVDREG